MSLLSFFLKNCALGGIPFEVDVGRLCIKKREKGGTAAADIAVVWKKMDNFTKNLPTQPMSSKYTYDESEIIEQLHSQSTCRAAFGRVIEHYSQPLYWQIRRMVIDHDDANDVLQNTFIKATTSAATRSCRHGSTR